MARPSNTDMTPSQINAALTAGIITPSQAKAMREKAGEAQINTADTAVFGNEDNLRFIRGFSDIFIALGIGLLTLGLWALTKLMGGDVLYFGTAAALWIASEYFGRKKRAHLPTLILALGFLFFIQKGAGALLPGIGNYTSISAAAITLLAMLAYYARFRLPFCIALICLSVIILLFSLLRNMAPDVVSNGFGAVMIMCGIAVFIIAMLYDMRDTDRLTRFSDNAFWLHLTAAPLIIHGAAVSTLLKTTRLEYGFLPTTDFGKPEAGLVLLVFMALTLVGLAINRRALIVSSLGYAAFALILLVKDTGIGFSGTAIFVLLVMGAGILLLGVGWGAARRLVTAMLPSSGIFAKIFPAEKPS